jgi:hypothetical protein
MRWDRVSAFRTALLILAGFAAIAYGAFLIYPPAGWIAAGVGLLLIEALTSPGQEEARRRA